MKSKSTLLLALLLSSCSGSEMFTDSELVPKVVLNASYNGSKSHFGETSGSEIPVLFDSTDELAVCSSASTVPSRFTTSENLMKDGGLSASFVGSVDMTGPFCAVFPYEYVTSEMTANHISINVPSEQEYAENSFGITSNITAATWNCGTSFQMKSLLGCMKLTVTGNCSVKKIALEDNDSDFALWGKLTAVPDASTGNITDISVSNSENGKNRIAITLENAAAITPETQKSFWFMIPEGAFAKGVTITIYDSNDQVIKVLSTDKNLGISRRKLTRLSPITISGPYIPEKGFPAVWDFYALGYDNSSKAKALEHSSAQNWKSDVANPTLKTTYGNSDAYLQVYAKDGLYEKDGMKVTLNPGIQACGLLKDDYYEFIIPVKGFTPFSEISVYGATGGSATSVAFWTLEYSADGKSWYEAPGAKDASVGSVNTKAHFWNTSATVKSKESRYVYLASADDSFHYYRFCCSRLGNIEDGNLHLRLRSQRYSGKFDCTDAEKGWSDIKAFHVYLASEKPNPLMKIVAHRGGYLENGHPEGSRAALKTTLSQNCCGSECDILWTKDGDLIAAHTDDYGEINGLIPSENTLAQIQAAGLLSNGETVPSFNDLLDIIMDDTVNPYGAQLWVDVKYFPKNVSLSNKATDLALEQASKKNALGRIVLMIKNSNYVEMSCDIRNRYGVEVAWNGVIYAPSEYGPSGWAQLPYDDYAKSAYWPPTTYTDNGVQLSIYKCASSLSGYNAMYKNNILQYYPNLKALFVNHPIDLVRHLVPGGYEQ